jgi:hypothetical protein
MRMCCEVKAISDQPSLRSRAERWVFLLEVDLVELNLVFHFEFDVVDGGKQGNLLEFGETDEEFKLRIDVEDTLIGICGCVPFEWFLSQNRNEDEVLILQWQLQSVNLTVFWQGNCMGATIPKLYLYQPLLSLPKHCVERNPLFVLTIHAIDRNGCVEVTDDKMGGSHIDRGRFNYQSANGLPVHIAPKLKYFKSLALKGEAEVAFGLALQRLTQANLEKIIRFDK